MSPSLHLQRSLGSAQDLASGHSSYAAGRTVPPRPACRPCSRHRAGRSHPVLATALEEALIEEPATKEKRQVRQILERQALSVFGGLDLKCMHMLPQIVLLLTLFAVGPVSWRSRYSALACAQLFRLLFDFDCQPYPRAPSMSGVARVHTTSIRGDVQGTICQRHFAPSFA